MLNVSEKNQSDRPIVSVLTIQVYGYTVSSKFQSHCSVELVPSLRMRKQTTENAGNPHAVLHLCRWRRSSLCCLASLGWSARVQLSDATLDFELRFLHPVQERSYG